MENLRSVLQRTGNLTIEFDKCGVFWIETRIDHGLCVETFCAGGGGIMISFAFLRTERTK